MTGVSGTYEQLGIGGQAVQLKLTAFDKRLLTRGRARPIYARFGRKGSIPRHGGKAISFRGLELIYPAGNAGSAAAGSAPAALTEGTPGTAINATWREVQATVSQYGQYILITDLTEEQSVDDVAAAYVDAMGDSMADAIDLLARDILVAGTSVQFASTGASRGNTGSGMYLTLAELREAKRTLKRQNAEPAEDGKYVVITHPDSMYDLEGDANITNVWQYAGARGMDNQLFDTSFKDLPMGFRIYETTNARVFASLGLSGADVIATLVLAAEAYGTIDLAALPARVITKERGSGGSTGDPLDQVASIGWKASYAAVITNQERMVRIEHVTSAKNAA